MAVPLSHPDLFSNRHIGPDEHDIADMLRVVKAASLDDLIDATLPRSIRLRRPLQLPAPIGERELLQEARALAARNQVFRSFLGMGYSDCITPAVIQRNILENPGWYTQYTPYQAEISQGRLEALLNYQTMIIDLTGLEVACASLLDEATAAAEAMTMVYRAQGKGATAPAHDQGKYPKTFFVSETCHPQTIAVVRTRALPLGIEVVVGDHRTFDFKTRIFGALLQYPATDGVIYDYRGFCERAHAEGALVVVAADLLGLTLLTPPGELGVDVAIGSTQRFGVPMGYGGPHAAYLATRNAHIRSMPGRIIGMAIDAQGAPALRMALQTREQHIRREKATSNICTAQVLLAIMAGMYAVYHGPKGLKAIAERVHGLAGVLARGLAQLGFKLRHDAFFDTLRVDVAPAKAAAVHAAARARQMNFRAYDDGSIGIAVDETTGVADLEAILAAFAGGTAPGVKVATLAEGLAPRWPQALRRTSRFLTHPVFNTHYSETEMQRYIRMLEGRDLSLTHAMIPLGSCTMKLNAAAEMLPVTLPGFCALHPFVPREQAAGYRIIFEELEGFLREITGFAAVSLQPNAGSQGEYTGLLVVRKYHESRGQGHRDVCLIPASAHGTNPASAVLAGYDVVVVECDEDGNIDVADLKEKVVAHRGKLAALMVTYPSTHGVFEEEIAQICTLVHEAGGQVYMDGANMNAQVGLCRPADIGADVCHLNLHKTFAIPHGGGGPGMGPIGVAAHLARFLPRHPVIETGGADGIGPVSAAPWGSASVLLISWAYIKLMGAEGLTRATQVAILNANYIARRLHDLFPVLYQGKKGRVAHECILDVRRFKRATGIEVDDIAKRLMDYGFHAPTVSFPVHDTLMIEPTESEPKSELDRFCAAMIAIHGEISEIESGAAPREGNVLKNAPHTAAVVTATEWNRPYTREKAAFPTPETRRCKFWPPVGRLNNLHGDRNPVFACPPVEALAAAPAAAGARAAKAGAPGHQG